MNRESALHMDVSMYASNGNADHKVTHVEHAIIVTVTVIAMIEIETHGSTECHTSKQWFPVQITKKPHRRQE